MVTYIPAPVHSSACIPDGTQLVNVNSVFIVNGNIVIKGGETKNEEGRVIVIPAIAAVTAQALGTSLCADGDGECASNARNWIFCSDNWTVLELVNVPGFNATLIPPKANDTRLEDFVISNCISVKEIHINCVAFIIQSLNIEFCEREVKKEGERGVAVLLPEDTENGIVSAGEDNGANGSIDNDGRGGV